MFDKKGERITQSWLFVAILEKKHPQCNISKKDHVLALLFFTMQLGHKF